MLILLPFIQAAAFSEFSEAHNIESECRDAGTAEVDLSKLMAAVEWCIAVRNDPTRRKPTQGKRSDQAEKAEKGLVLMRAADKVFPIVRHIVCALVKRRSNFEGPLANAAYGGVGGGDGGGGGGGDSARPGEWECSQVVYN
ncbi:hypothetical protein T492DRAFT_836301 [Pavlovales sp. CCMP2436]|nr:hypothetical protein T492DRAFT_836301 [Pavlovales sp. CCMP2436]